MKAKFSLNETERTVAQKFVRQGKVNARTLTRAWIVLKLADGWDEAKIAETFAVTQTTVKNVAHRFAEGGLDLVLHDKVQQRRRQALSGPQAAHLIAITCSPAPDGHDHWTVRLLAQKAVELGFVRSISPNTIHELLKKTNSNPGGMNTGACPPSEASLSRRWKTC
jgi:transposase